MRCKFGVILNQRKYLLELISDIGLSGSKSMTTPLESNLKLTTLEHDQTAGLIRDDILSDASPYRRLVGQTHVCYHNHTLHKLYCANT